jgi:hypothetical protein
LVPRFDEPLGEKVAGGFENFLDLPVWQWINNAEQQKGPRASSLQREPDFGLRLISYFRILKKSP